MEVLLFFFFVRRALNSPLFSHQFSLSSRGPSIPWSEKDTVLACSLFRRLQDFSQDLACWRPGPRAQRPAKVHGVCEEPIVSREMARLEIYPRDAYLDPVHRHDEDNVQRSA